MERENSLQRISMELGQPKDSLCETCKFKEKDMVIDGENYPRWKSLECDKYIRKPLGVLFRKEKCDEYEASL